ncbi:hypothetical protein [Streptomyces sp. NPDC056600]|uniref:hypothetical protein n=1 Tax=Streptomyces sp. NPDC056600 TaxID=3345874 RepID=UPI0036BF139F
MTAGLAAAAGAVTTRQAAAAAEYLLVTVEQSANQIQRWSTARSSWSGTPDWYWTAPARSGAWYGLSDVKRRLTANWDDVLVTCAGGTPKDGGRAAMVRESDGAIVWQTVVPGHPHAIERIDGHGAIVTASANARVFGQPVPDDPSTSQDESDPDGKFEAGGGLNLFVPSSHGGLPPTSFADSVSTGFPGAHGVLWDNDNDLLLAIGKEELRAYSLVTNGSGIITGLTRRATLSFSGMGHDLQPDYSSGKILYTVGGDGGNPDAGVWETTLVWNSTDAEWNFVTPTRVHTWWFIKSFSRLPDGKEFCVDAPSAEEWWSDRVGYYQDGAYGYSVRPGAKFYKARFWSHVLS